MTDAIVAARTGLDVTKPSASGPKGRSAASGDGASGEFAALVAGRGEPAGASEARPAGAPAEAAPSKDAEPDATENPEDGLEGEDDMEAMAALLAQPAPEPAPSGDFLGLELAGEDGVVPAGGPTARAGTADPLRGTTGESAGTGRGRGQGMTSVAWAVLAAGTAATSGPAGAMAAASASMPGLPGAASEVGATTGEAKGAVLAMPGAAAPAGSAEDATAGAEAVVDPGAAQTRPVPAEGTPLGRRSLAAADAARVATGEAPREGRAAAEQAEGEARTFDALPKAPEPPGAPTGASRPATSRTEEAAPWSSVAAATRELEAEGRGAQSAGPLDRAGDVPAVPLAQAEAGVAPTGAPAAEGAGTARRIARQIVDQPVLRTGGATELSLYPEELGHLRLTVEGTDGNLRVIIEAARPETADLMRRHVETLRQELRQEGLGSVGVSIGGGEARRDDGSPARRSGEGGFGGPGQGGAPSSEAGPATALSLAARSRAAGGHLDIRF